MGLRLDLVVAAFVIIFSFLPLGYGWGYRGWGPPNSRRIPAQGPEHRADTDVGWGVVGIGLWIALLVVVVRRRVSLMNDPFGDRNTAWRREGA